MLGRQQIAGVPTAISELFKNAHDAYAHSVAVDLLRRLDLMVIRDDGTGMSPDGFEQRWLTLGTDDKVVGGRARAESPPAGQLRRPVLGEKGIGRLAIAALGSQVVVVTRAADTDETLVALVNWTLFEIPGLNLNELEIPTTVLSGAQDCDADVVRGLAGRLLSSIDDLDAALPLVGRAKAEVASLAFDPAEVSRILPAPTLSNNRSGHGTEFWISPISETVTAALETPFKSGPDRGTPPIEKLLLGFTDTMLPGRENSVIHTSFRDWTGTSEPDDLIAKSEFFTPNDFEAADHHIAGDFDEWGRFEGSVRVYQADPVEHVVAWSGASSRRTACGPFRLDLAIVQGNVEDSLVSPLEWASLTQKLNRIGGLYIYRDGIRVLPYGNNDYDFLNIEKRRTLNAARWYFSYRRMMGIVSLDGTANRSLEEKAGREGFLENLAYRQFRDILANFFVQTVSDFFRTDGTGGGSDQYMTRLSELRQTSEERKRKERQRLARRKAFEASVGDRGAEIVDGQAGEAVDAVMQQAIVDFANIEQLGDLDDAARLLAEAEVDLQSRLRAVRKHYTLARPRGMGLSRRLVADLDAYDDEFARFAATKLDPAFQFIASEAERLASSLGEAASRKSRLQASVADRATEAQNAVREEGRVVRRELDKTVDGVTTFITHSNQEMRLLATRTADDAVRQEVSGLDPDGFELLRTEMLGRLDEAELDTRTRLQIVLGRIESLASQLLEPGADIEAADQDELLALREREALDFELVQLGQAIAIIDHEFNAAISEVRSSLRDLRPWAESNPSFGSLYERIRTGFDHLDGYLRMFTPLQRQLQREPIPITGTEIRDYLVNLFAERIRRHEVTVEFSDEFRAFEFRGIPSVYFPVFVNLMDNALYWATTRHEGRSIRLDVQDRALIVEDSGPGVIAADLERVFDLGFSRRDGRGMGLYIARRALSESGTTVHLDLEGSALGGARFVVTVPSDEGSGEGP